MVFMAAFVAACAAFVACSSDDDLVQQKPDVPEESVEEGIPMTVKVADLASRGTDLTTSTLEGFTLYSTMTDAWKTGKLFGKDAGGNWTTNTDLSWPDDNTYTFFGISDVDNFADEVTETVKGLEKKIAELEEQLKAHEEKADSVQNAIITAEIAAKNLMKDASSKAEKIMSEAVEKSNKIVEESQKTADKNLYEAGEKARIILDNALSSSAQCVEENNRIIEDQKIYISVLQDESVKFREKLLEMYKKCGRFSYTSSKLMLCF